MLREGGGWIVGVEATGVGEDPGVAAAEKGLLEANSGVFDAGDYPVRTHAQKGNDRRSPITYFGLEALAAGTKLVVGEFVRTGGGAFDNTGDAEFEVEQERFFKRGEDP